MNKLIAFLFSVFLFGNALFGTVFQNIVSEAEFNSAFEEDMVWYVEIRSGGTGGANSHEFEIGTPSGVVYNNGQTNWINESENPFLIEISESGFLSVTVNDSVTPSGNQPGITDPFNRIYVGLSLDTNDDLDVLSITEHQYEGASLANPTIEDGTSPDAWYGFVINDDQRPANIGSFILAGNLVPDMFVGDANNGPEGWTYTVYGASVPEPEAYALLFGLATIIVVWLRKRK